VNRSSVPDIEVVTLDRAHIVHEPWSWPFATERRGDIDRHFAELQRQRSGVWNGRALLLHRYTVKDRALDGACFETDYATLCAWRDWQLPNPSVYNVFAAAALQSADGAWLVGEMAPDTAAAGLVYFPCGTPEPDDIDATGTLDLAGNLARELLEETGIDIAETAAAPGWTFVRDRNFIGLLKPVRARQNADALRTRIMGHIAQQKHPEFIAIRILRGPRDLDSRLPNFVVAFLEHAWRQ
jgi:8-oxo-dGTP pyrophosphatase MutT (NUDIX family)